jgi:nucleotide-binding universal stress UspA family protein
VADVLKIARGNVLVLKDRGLQDVRRIIVPVSGGSHALLGLRLAQDLADEWKASITALNVQIGRGPSAAHTEFDRQSIQLFQDKAGEFVKDTLDAVGVSADVEVVIDTDIARAIAKTAQKQDLIVIGASEEWALRRRLFGSIPDKVADRAEASVLMVRSKT